MRKNIPLMSDPAQLKESIKLFSKPIGYQDFVELTHSLYSHNSLLSMVNDWNRFVEFCITRHVNPLPASVTAIRLFLEHEGKQRKYASIRRYSLTIGLIHRLHSLPEPTNHRQIHFTLSALRNMKKGDAAQATPFTEKHLNEIFKCLGESDSIKDLRDLLIYSLMFECFLKRGQLRDLTCHQLDLLNDECAQLMIGENTYQLTPRTSQLLQKWLAVLGDEYQGALFCRIDKHGNLGTESLNDSSIYRVFRRASDLLNLPQHLAFSGQSSRVGASQDLYKKGYNLRQIQQLGRWTSAVMPAQYIGKHALSESEQLLFKKIKSWD